MDSHIVVTGGIRAWAPERWLKRFVIIEHTLAPNYETHPVLQMPDVHGIIEDWSGHIMMRVPRAAYGFTSSTIFSYAKDMASLDMCNVAHIWHWHVEIAEEGVEDMTLRLTPADWEPESPLST